eukprot:5131898-Pyramimonas_sp.AAC.1
MSNRKCARTIPLASCRPRPPSNKALIGRVHAAADLPRRRPGSGPEKQREEKDLGTARRGGRGR